MSDAAVKAQDLAVEAWLQAKTQANPARVARVYAKFAYLSDAQIRYRQGRESWLSPLLEQSEALAIDGRGNRIHPPADT
jgi:hypothetical protein